MPRAVRHPAQAVSPAVTVTYYVEVLSSWCHWAEPAWTALKQRYPDRVHFEWRIALMRPTDFPHSREQCDWFYQRSGLHVRSPIMLHSGWLEPERAGHYEAPNFVAEAARQLGKTPDDDHVRLALTHAAVREGRRIGDLDTAVKIAATASGLAPARLKRAAESAAVRDVVHNSTAAFHAMQLTQRPAFVVESVIGDKAMFSGVWQAAPLIATIDGMLEDAASYAAHAAHHPPLPSA